MAKPDQTVPDEIVAEDRRLTLAVVDTDAFLKSVEEQRSITIAERNQFRWEMTVCEHGPHFSQRAYAEAVGFTQQAISWGVKAWQTVLDSRESTSHLSIRGD